MGDFFKQKSKVLSDKTNVGGSKDGKKTARLMPWVEKYRPKTVKDISHQEDVVKTLLQSIETGNVPHLLFYGSPGTGKTSSALAFARELYGPELLKSRILELNASDERGINVVREKIKAFASTAVGKATYKGRPLPPFKLIILDEADSMTEDAQSALRRTMELYTRVTRFILICNYVSRIIEPIASRCAKFRFQPLANTAIESRLEFVCKEEGITYTKDTLKTLIDVSEGDMRRAITLLQSSAQYNSMKVASDIVLDVAGRLPDKILEEFGKAMECSRFEGLQKFITNVACEGYGLDTILDQLQGYIIQDAKLSDAQKSILCVKFAQVDKALEEGANEELQLQWILSHAHQVYNKVTPATIASV